MVLTANITLTEHEQQILHVMARQVGTSQDELVRTAVQRLIAEFEALPAASQRLRMKGKGQQQSDAAKQQARQRFESHFGALNLGYATGVDNEQIDADLAQAYLATHEEN
ncbi:MAG: hypothetical protein DYG89_28965 [Caldilinea sp. CFX5]|nr:hypothetical protein [Caldilinea sp. CFX5]